MLTQRQQEVLDTIIELTQETGFPPTAREIGERADMWVSSVHKTLLRLRDEGLVTWEPNRARTLVVLPSDQQQDLQN